MQQLTTMALPQQANSLAIIEMSAQTGFSGATSLYLSIGLLNGVYMRAHIDSTTGDLSDVRTRYDFPFHFIGFFVLIELINSSIIYFELKRSFGCDSRLG